jgi:murein DD-endopeptidase MepM/ murein hydrolase activator NlpD
VVTALARDWMRRSVGSPAPVAMVVAVVAAIWLLVSVGGAAEASDEERLAEARRQLEAIGAQLSAAESDVEEADEELEDADQLLAEVEAVVNDVATAVDGQQEVVARTEQRLERLEGDRDLLVRAFNQRATRVFKMGPTQAWDMLLTGSDAADAMARSAYLRIILEGDQVDLEVLEAAGIAVSAERERADEERARLARLLEEQEAILAEAQELRESRALAAANARDRVELLREEQDDLEAEQERIEALIERRQAEERERQAAARAAAAQQASSGSSSGGSSSGGSSGGGSSSGGQASAPSGASSAGYSWPLCAPVTSEYGPRWGRMHRGIDLGAPTGTPIGAAKGGTVISAGWQGGYGRLLLIDHGDGVVTAYAHLSSFAVSSGQSVQRGQTIGRIGMTGNTTGPHLHLEFRVNGRAVNPRQYLSGRPC